MGFLSNLCTFSISVLGFAVLVDFSEGATPSFIKPCSLTDASCLEKSARAALPMFAAGVPALGLEPLDPMHISKMGSDEAGLHLEFTDSTITGLKGCQLPNIKYDAGRHKLSMEARCNVTLKGDYVIGGRLLVLPIRGNGKYKIKITTIVVNVEFNVGSARGEGGAEHWDLKYKSHKFKIIDNTNFRFQNLFDGNKLLSDTTHKFSNENWQTITSEVAPPIVAAIVVKISASIHQLFEKLPLSDLAIV